MLSGDIESNAGSGTADVGDLVFVRLTENDYVKSGDNKRNTE
jgi:hypothetical protein